MKAVAVPGIEALMNRDIHRRASHDVIPLLTGGQDQPPGRLCIVEQTVDYGAW
jgi:hypothetical protein